MRLLNSDEGGNRGTEPRGGRSLANRDRHAHPLNVVLIWVEESHQHNGYVGRDEPSTSLRSFTRGADIGNQPWDHAVSHSGRSRILQYIA